MTQAETADSTPSADGRSTVASRRVGYIVGIAVNAGLLVIARNIVTWGWFPWLTDSWNDLVPLVTLSLLAGIAVNVVYLWFDVDWFKSLTQAILAGISLIVTVRIFTVFPFDFSASDSGWETITRAILIFMMLGISIGLVAETVKFVSAIVRRSSSAAPAG